MDKPRGGWAFPQNDAAVNRINNEAGMSLRDYFAAHAPKRPQEWFQPNILPKPEPIWPCSHTTEHVENCNCSAWDVSEENWRERYDYDRMKKHETLKQWPYAWADAMLKARGSK